MKKRKNRNKSNNNKIINTKLKKQTDIGKSNISNDSEGINDISKLKIYINKEEKNLQDDKINEKELKEFMIYYETDQIDDLNLNY